jgi:uncharacterized protein with GYD domain
LLYVTLLEPKGRGAEAVEHLKKLKAPSGVTVHGVYFTLGRYDAVILFEAADHKTALNFVMDIGFKTDYKTETLAAAPAKEV